MQARQRPSSAPGSKSVRHRRRSSAERPEAEDARDTDNVNHLLTVQGSPKKVKFVEGANLAPRGSAQAVARFALQQCQHRLQVATTLRRGDRLSPRSGKLYRPSSAQVNFQRTAVGNLQVVYPPTTEVLSMVRKMDGEVEEDFEEDPAEQAEVEVEESNCTDTPSMGGVQDLDCHVRKIWFMYQEQEEATDEKDKALLLALRGPDDEDREEALLNEMKQLKTGEDAIAFFAKHGDQSDLQVIHCVAAHVEEGQFRPYDLVVVDEKDKGNEYFMISPKGIVHICPGKQSEHTTLTSWMHQVMIYTVLVSMSFFRHYLRGRAFQRWRSGASNQIYAKHRHSLSRRLFLAKPTFVEAQVKVHEVLRSWSFTRLLVLDHHNSAMGAMELRPFLQQQRELCEHADLDTTADAAREVLDEAIKKLMTNTDDWLSQDARLMKMMRGRNVSVFAKRQAAEREAYRKKLCEFNRSLIGNFIRLVDVIQQSCLVDLVVSKSWYLLDRFARSSKLFQTSPTFGNAPSRDGTGIPLALEPGKKDFQEGMQQVLEQILAVCKVPTVVSYRKYLRHFKQDVVGTANPTDVIRNDQTFRSLMQGLMKQIDHDFEKAQQFCESHLAVVYQIHLHSLSWDTEAFVKAQHTHETLARGMSEMQVFDKHLHKLTTKHPAGFLAIEVSALLKDAVRHVTSSIKTMQSQLSALALESCKQAAVRYHEVNQKLQERPKGLESLVEYVRTFKRIEADLPNLKALKSSVEDMYATLAQHNIRSVAADDFQRDLMTQRAVTFENDTMPGAQFFLNEQEETAVTEVANRYSSAEQDVEELQDEIVAGMASDPSCLTQAFQVLEYLDKVGQKLDDFEKTFKYLNDCYVLFMQQPQDLELLEEARQTWELRYRLWGIAAQWLDTTAKIASEALVRVDVSKIRCQLQGFVQVLSDSSNDLATDPVVIELRDTVDAWFAERVPVWAQMTGPAMGPQHWVQVVGTFSDPESLKVSSLDFILSGVVAEKGRKNLAAATQKAAVEHGLVCTVWSIIEAWEHVEMSLKEPADSEAPWLLQNTDSILDLLHEDMTALQQALKSPQSNAIQTEAREILSKLGRACEVLREVDRLQEEYCRLEPLFRMKVLGDDEASARAVEKFGTSDEVWRLLMHRAQSSCKTVLHFTGQSTVSKQLQRIWDGVKIAKEAVEKILDLRRRQSPRLWFVTDATLTEALSSAQNLSRGKADTKELQTDTAQQRNYQMADAAAGKTLADFMSSFFPWTDQANACLIVNVQEKKARRSSTTGHLMRQEVDRAMNRQTTEHSEHSETGDGRGDSSKLVQGVSTSDLKSAVLGSPMARSGKWSGAPLAGSSSLVEDVARKLEEAADTEDQMQEIKDAERLDWSRSVAMQVHGEEIQLSWSAVSCTRGALLGSWLNDAERSMKQYLQLQIKQAFQRICAFSLVDVICEWVSEGLERTPGQALLAAAELFVTHAMEASMEVEDQAGVALVFGQVDEMLEGLQQALPRLLRLPLCRARRMVLSSCWLQALHWQEQLQSLKQAWTGGSSRESFGWKRFLRRRWELTTGTVMVTCLDWAIPYGYEYVGLSPMVRTPQTDQCFLAFASAFDQGHAAVALQAPPESGKAEMIAELARTAAVPLVNSGGPESLSIPSMLQFLASIASTNAWGYMRSLGLEELKFNDEASNLLAALADALSQLLSAAREGKKEVQLGPYQVRCTRKPKVFFFVLPASLPKSLVLELRPIAVAEPPKARIVQVLLELEGFDAQASEKLATGLLARADDIVNNGAVGQKYTSCGLQRLRVAIAAAGEALRREEGMSGVVLAAAAALVPGEGSSHRRSWLGPSGNPVLAEQSKLLSELAVAEEDVSGQHAEDAWQADTDQFVQRVEAFCTTSGLSPGKKTQLKHREVPHVALAALEVFQHINKGHATVLLGPACCGKSVVLKAVQAAGHCPGTIETSKPQLCLWYLYPQALADDQGEGCGFDQMLPCLLETITQRHANTHAELATEQEGEPLRQSRVQDLIVFDGEMDETWMEQVWPLVQKRQMLTSGRSMALPSSAELIFETRRLDRASPSFCASCALCPLEDTVGIKELLEAFGERIAKGFAGRAARLHSRILLAWLSRLASNIQEDLRGVDESMNEMVTAQQLLHLLEVTWRTVLPMDLEANDDGEELWESEITLLEVWSIYCAAWVLGGPLDTSLRRRLGSWLLQKSEGANGLPHGLAALQQVREDPENLWKFRIVSNAAALTGLREVTGSTTVKLLWEVLPDPQELDAHHLYVPNEESEAIRLLVRHQVRVECGLGFRLFGPSSGKSALGEHLVLSRTHTSRCTFELLRCPHQISAAGFAGFVQEKMPRKGSRTLSSLPVKTCIVVDDVHLGSLGMREQLRQVLDRGHVTAAPSQEGGAWRAPGLWLGAIDRDAGNTGERWLRHALALRHPDLSERSLIEVCTRFVLRWSVQVPSEEARLMLISQSFPDRVVQVVLEASSSFHRSSPFAARSPLLDLKRWSGILVRWQFF